MKVLIDQDRLQAGVRQLACDINAHYGRTPLTIIGVLTGSIILLADLIRLLEMPLRVGVIQASSYRGGTVSGELAIRDEWMPDIAGRHVLFVDDIFDTGKTLVELRRRAEALQPQSVETAVLLRKTGKQEVDYQPTFVAFDIPDVFVVGYGLDYGDFYRNLNYVAELEPDDLERT